MDRSLFLDLLSFLPAKDQNEFSRYLDTDFFNRSPLIKQLYLFMRKELKRGVSKVEKRHAFELLFPQKKALLKGKSSPEVKKVLGKHLDPLLYRLKKHLEDYLVWKQGKEEGFLRDQMALQALYDLNADRHFFKKCDRVLADLEQSCFAHSDFHLRKYLVMRMRYYQFSRVNLDVASTEKELVKEHLDTYFLVQTLIQSYASITRNLIYGANESLPFLDRVVEQASLEVHADNFYVKVFLPLIRGLNQGIFDPNYFTVICKLIPESIDEISPEEQYGIYKILLDYYLFLEQFTLQPLPPQFFYIVEKGILQGYLLQNGKLTYLSMMAFVRTACVTKEYAKAERLLVRFKDQVTYQGEPGVTTVPLAYLAFSQGNYREALKVLLQSEKAKYMVDKVLERLIMMQCYYEIGETELLEHCLEGSRKFVARLDGAGLLVQGHFSNFLHCLRDLSRMREEGKSPQQWLEKLQCNSLALEQTWLQAKARELVDQSPVEKHD